MKQTVAILAILVALTPLQGLAQSLTDAKSSASVHFDNSSFTSTPVEMSEKLIPSEVHAEFGSVLIVDSTRLRPSQELSSPSAIASRKLQGTDYTFRHGMTVEDPLTSYFTEILQLALDHTYEEYGSYRLYSMPFISNPRLLLTMHNPTPLNLITALSYDPRHTQNGLVKPIYIPYNYGISGYRVCFVNPKIKNELAKVKNLTDLRKFTFAQGIGWTDTLILRNAGLKVIESSNYRGLFQMVASGRIDLFCRSIHEWSEELIKFGQNIPLVLDEHLLISYDMPKLFYMRTAEQEAHERIELGLKRAFEDGSLTLLWDKHYRQKIEASNLHKRTRIHLENPLNQGIDLRYRNYNIDIYNRMLQLHTESTKNNSPQSRER